MRLTYGPPQSGHRRAARVEACASSSCPPASLGSSARSCSGPFRSFRGRLLGFLRRNARARKVFNRLCTERARGPASYAGPRPKSDALSIEVDADASAAGSGCLGRQEQAVAALGLIAMDHRFADGCVCVPLQAEVGEDPDAAVGVEAQASREVTVRLGTLPGGRERSERACTARSFVPQICSSSAGSWLGPGARVRLSRQARRLRLVGSKTREVPMQRAVGTRFT